MECEGIAINREKMQNLILKNDAKIKVLTAEIYELKMIRKM